MSELLAAIAIVGINSIIGWLTSDAMSNEQDKKSKQQVYDDRVYQGKIDNAMGATENGAEFDNANI